MLDKHIIVYRDEEKYKNALENIRASDLTERNKQLVLEFATALRRDGIGFKRVSKYLYHLKFIGRWLGKDFDKAEKEDIMKVADHIDSNGYTINTIYDYKIAIKKFYKWLLKVDVDPFKLKTASRKQRTKLPSPEELFSEEEIKRMISVAGSIRNKAIIITLYETSARASEFLTLQKKDIEFDDNGAKIRLVGKTGERYVRVVSCVPYLSNWLENHRNESLDDFVWISENRNSKRRLEYGALCKLVREIMVRSGVKKRGNLHSFRKSRATHLANFLTESQLCYYMGWSIGSKEVITYVKASMRGTEDAILGIYGIKKDDNHKSVLQPIKCPVCGWFNKDIVNFCCRCGKPLTLQSALERDARREKADKIMDVAVKYPEMLKLLEEIIRKENIAEQKPEIVDILLKG